MSHSDEVVVITGGTAGVGRATAEAFAREGRRIGILARGKDRLEQTAIELRRLGASAVLGVPCDVADPEAVDFAAARIEHELGPVDIWINNAMSTVFGRFQEMTPREYTRVTEVTYLGYVWGTRAALDRMIPRRRGTIVQVGSALAYRSIPLQSAYCGAKHAIAGFTDSIRSELIHDDIPIHLTMVQLPAVNTPQFSWCKSYMPYEPQPVPPIFQPEVIARAIHDAAYAHQREVYVGWPAVKAILGQRLAPSYADRYLAKNGFEGQYTDQPTAPDRPSNLFEPVPLDVGAHGAFDERAKRRSPVARLTSLLGSAGVTIGFHAAVGLGIAGAAWLLARKTSR